MLPLNTIEEAMIKVYKDYMKGEEKMKKEKQKHQGDCIICGEYIDYYNWLLVHDKPIICQKCNKEQPQ